MPEKCRLGFASRMRSEHSDEQSAEQLQEVDHPEARIAHRGICASPDAIFGSHSDFLLHLDRATHGIDHARKFRQEAVTGVLYDPAAMLRDLRIDQFPEVGLEALMRPSSSAPKRREYPATSAARMAARRRVWLTSRRRPLNAGPTGIARAALRFGRVWR